MLNMQFAIKDDVVYVLEVNPRASRTVPFASKATGLPLARIAAQVMAGQTLAELGVLTEPRGGRLLCQRSRAALQEAAQRYHRARARKCAAPAR